MSGAPRGLRPPDAAALSEAVARALAEDRVSQDVTTLATVPPGQSGRGSLLIKQDGVLCGLDTVREVYRQLGGGVAVEALAADGDAVRSRQVVATVAGPLAPLLSGERVALNFLQRLSGIATLTRAFVERAAEGGAARITDTRKTTPGLRALERYAVRAGGADNHRGHPRGWRADQGQPPGRRRRARDRAAAAAARGARARPRTPSASRSRRRTWRPHCSRSRRARTS